MAGNETLTVAGAAQRLGVSAATIRNAIKRGEISAETVQSYTTTTRRLSAQDVDEWAAARRTGGGK